MKKITVLFFIVILIFVSAIYGETNTNIRAVTETKTNRLRFVVYGDSRTLHNVHMSIVELIEKEKPEMIIHTGDMTANGHNDKDWFMFKSITKNLRENIPYYAVIGNHERDSEDYYELFGLDTSWYYIDSANSHFIFLDSNKDYSEGSEQYNWLTANLKESAVKKYDFIFAFLHHPPFSSGRHGSYEEIQQSLVPLFEKFGVDMVFSGHDHIYEHSIVNKVHYIVTAGGGAPLYYKENENEYSKTFASSFHFCVIEIENEKLKLRSISIKGKFIDTFNLKK